MGCCSDLLATEGERKGEENMNRLVGSEINISFDEQNINKENPNNKNEESEIYQQKNINLFDLKHEKRTNLRYVLANNEEDNLICVLFKLIKNKEQIIPKENKNLNKGNYIPLNQEEEEEKQKDQLKFNKDLCKTLAPSLPKRTKLNTNHLRIYLN